MKKFTAMDQAVLEQTTHDKLLPRFVKKGNDTVKQLAQSILNNAAAATKAKKEQENNDKKVKLEKPAQPKENAPASGTNKTPSFEVVITNRPPTVSGVKRPR